MGGDGCFFLHTIPFRQASSGSWSQLLPEDAQCISLELCVIAGEKVFPSDLESGNGCSSVAFRHHPVSSSNDTPVFSLWDVPHHRQSWP